MEVRLDSSMVIYFEALEFIVIIEALRLLRQSINGEAQLMSCVSIQIGELKSLRRFAKATERVVSITSGRSTRALPSPTCQAHQESLHSVELGMVLSS